MRREKLILFVFITVFCSCLSNIEFDSGRWKADDGESKHGDREIMVYNLINSKKLKGLTHKQIINLLGPTMNGNDKNETMSYSITVDYGWDIDPVYSKSLIIKLNKDSVATSFEVKEWKNK